MIERCLSCVKKPVKAGISIEIVALFAMQPR